MLDRLERIEEHRYPKLLNSSLVFDISNFLKGNEDVLKGSPEEHRTLNGQTSFILQG